jgi:hypothetical protein
MGRLDCFLLAAVQAPGGALAWALTGMAKGKPWAWQGRTQNRIGSWPRANQASRGAWAAPPDAWSASSWVQPKRHVAFKLPPLLV